MSTRKGKRYTTSYKEKQHPKQDPYAMLKAPKGPTICRKCTAIYSSKRWHFDEVAARKLAASPRTKKLVCPACQKTRDDYPEGVVTLTWADLREHEPEIRGLIANVETRAVAVNPLDRVMKIVRRKKDLEVQTTNDRLAQRLGRALVRAYKGKAVYKWAHRDMMVRVTWHGPEAKAKRKAARHEG
ncbi:MAG: BCAM0308 family protein [Nitrospira sp.]|nr:BCAM0308 family protein [Nitrospira sp.]MDH5193117.1 BCAM0308 family protein [Nitrospira sp.]